MDHAHDEPFGDAANIPLFLLSKELKGKIKVVLQGDGGDEFFGGYSLYNTITNVNKWKLFSPLSKLIQLSRTKHPELLRLMRFVEGISEKNPALRNALLSTTETIYGNPLKVFDKDLQSELINCEPFKAYENLYVEYGSQISSTQAIFYTDTQILLKDTYFDKVDRSTMANSMEVRVPFVDKHLTEFMLSIPAELKVKNGVKKYLLKKALHDILPHDILYGPKTGFGVPYGYWLKTSLAKYSKPA